MTKLLLPLTLLLLLLVACSDSAQEGAADPGGTPAEEAAADQPANAQEPPAAPQPPPFDPGSFTLELEPALTGLRAPVFVTHAGDGSGRLFVVEQGGTIRVATGGQGLREAVLDIKSLVVSGGERGPLGLAFHPRHPEKGAFLVAHTGRGTGVS